MNAADPCIGLCGPGVDGTVCRGCWRTPEEVALWDGWDERRRGAVLRRLLNLEERAVRSVLPDSEIESLGGTPRAAVAALRRAARRGGGEPPLALCADEAHLLFLIQQRTAALAAEAARRLPATAGETGP